MKDLLIALVFYVFSSKNGYFFNINGACKAIDVDTRREVVIKTGKTSTNNRSLSISKEPTAQYFLKCNYCAFGSWEIVKDLLLALVFHIFSRKNGHFFNINGACKAIDVDTRCEVVIKTWKISANNRSFSISQEPTAQYFFK